MKFSAFNIPALKGIPPEIKYFLKRALIIFVIWKLLYHLILLPIRIPDKPLTQLTAYSTAVVWKVIMQSPMAILREEYQPDFPRTTIVIQNKRIIGVADPCNGLELFVLYIAFLFCIPATNARRFQFLIGGVAAIFVANILRCFGLAWLFVNHYPFANFAHHYLFKMMIYAMIFFIWVRFSKKTLENVK